MLKFNNKTEGSRLHHLTAKLGLTKCACVSLELQGVDSGGSIISI